VPVAGGYRRGLRLGPENDALTDDSDDQEGDQAQADDDRRSKPPRPATHPRGEPPDPQQAEQGPEADHAQGQDVDPANQDRSHPPLELHIEQGSDEGISPRRSVVLVGNEHVPMIIGCDGPWSTGECQGDEHSTMIRKIRGMRSRRQRGRPGFHAGQRGSAPKIHGAL